jgi:hypothetical protein
LIGIPLLTENAEKLRFNSLYPPVLVEAEIWGVTPIASTGSFLHLFFSSLLIFRE